MKNLIFIFLIFLSVFARGLEYKKKKIKLAGIQIMAEIADTDELREHGLMNRTTLKEGEAMLFVFPATQPLNFWMKNTLIPLSIGYFDSQGKLFQILDMEPASPVDLHPKTYPSEKAAKYALEVPKGWYEKKNIKLGSKLLF